jgi:hypothetical protein
MTFVFMWPFLATRLSQRFEHCAAWEWQVVGAVISAESSGMDLPRIKPQLGRQATCNFFGQLRKALQQWQAANT